jgi:hypothetical protein
VPGARPTAPPTQPTPQAGPVPAGPSDRELIINTLNAYAAAYGRRDVDAVIRLHPTLDRGRLAKQFGDLKSQTVVITPLGAVAPSGNTATVATNFHTRLEPRVGKAQELDVRTEFRLQKQNGTWVIVDRR